MDRELDEVDIEAESTDGYVRVRQLGQSRFIVVIRPGAIDRLDDRRLTGELNSAIRQVKRQYSDLGRIFHDRPYRSVD